jgi:hypothetical protein
MITILNVSDWDRGRALVVRLQTPPNGYGSDEDACEPASSIRQFSTRQAAQGIPSNLS